MQPGGDARHGNLPRLHHLQAVAKSPAMGSKMFQGPGEGQSLEVLIFVHMGDSLKRGGTHFKLDGL